MNRLLSLSALALALTAATADAAPGTARVPVTTILTVDGAGCGTVARWEGGDMRLAIRTTGAGRSLGSPACAPVSIDVAFPAAPPVMELIDDLCAGGGKRATLVLADVAAGGAKEASGIEVHDALLTEVRFPALGGGARDPLRLTLVF